MTALIKARQFAAHAPREALADLLGFAAVCALIFAGLMVPAFF